MNQIKPAVCFDDDFSGMKRIIDSIRIFGGLPVKYFSCIEAFFQYHNLAPGDTEGFKEVLKLYSALITDNNFDGAKKRREDTLMSGANFLLDLVGPTILEMDEATRPMLVCFAPSNTTIIRKYQNKFWETFQILSFERTIEFSLVGLAVKLRQKTGVLFSRKQIIENILGLQEEEENDTHSPVGCLSMDLYEDHLYALKYERKPEFLPYNYDAKPLAWNKLVDSLAQKLKIEPKELLERIDREAEIVRSGKEGDTGQTGRKEINI